MIARQVRNAYLIDFIAASQIGLVINTASLWFNGTLNKRRRHLKIAAAMHDITTGKVTWLF